MAQHKAPTAVTIAPTTEASGFALWVERIWKPALIVALVATAVILYSQYAQHSKRKAQDQSWVQLMTKASEDRTTGRLTGPPAELQALEGEMRGTQAGPWALFIAATSAVEKRDFDAAKSALAQIRSQYPEHALLRDKVSITTSEGPLSAVDRLERRIDAQKAWIAAHPGLFQNPELPADAPRVRLRTDRGDIVVGLYTNLAPTHAERFLRLVREGAYAGTRFHSVISGQMIQGGDPTSVKEEDRATWGQGGFDTKVEPEESPLKHFAGVLSAAVQPGSEPTVGSQFLITTGDAHQLDGQHRVFGRVLEGMELVHQIEGGALAAGTTRPEDPVTIQSAEVL
jgi:peptidyl-prolyl cis-trans isomerase B (cyclophilin B)